MEIIQKKNQLHSFRVLKPFHWGGYVTEIGQELMMADSEAIGKILAGRVEPIIPSEIECVCLCDLAQPGNKQAYKAKKFEKVLLRKEQFLELALQRQVVPVDPAIWRPYGLRLKLKEGKGKKRL